MSPNTKKALAIIGGIIIVVAVSVFATLTVQVWHKQNAAIETAAVEPVVPPAPPAPPAPVMAQVTAVQPHYVTSTKPVKQCKPVQHVSYPPQQQKPPIAGAVIGGVAGGLAGSAVHGNYRDAAIATGAVVGAATGATVQNNMNKPQPQVTESMHCTTHNVTSKTQKGYEVTYVSNNQSTTMLMDTAPAVGSMIPLPGQTVPAAGQGNANSPAPVGP